jgi:cation:H+ antiporter
MLLVTLIVFSLASIDLVISRLDGLFFAVIYAAYNIYVFIREEKGASEIGEEVKAGVCWRKQDYKIDLLYLAIGIILVVFSSTFIVENTIQLAEILEVDPFLISVILVGLGTSLPELVVSLKSARKGEPDVSLGNVIGSNVTDLLLATGLAAIIAESLQVDSNVLLIDIPFAFGASSIFLLLAWKKLKIDKSLSILMTCLFVSFIVLKIAFDPSTFM